MRLAESLPIGARTAPSRVMFGPHVTNLGDDDRSFTDRHVAYYERRARGGAGIIVTEGAGVHASDWPYERAPLAERCAEGWHNIATACHAHGALVIASLDHAGGQGSSAYSQSPLWAPSRVPEVNTREVPKWMEDADIAAVIDGFGRAARLAVESGLDGVEINAGQHSLVRQFMSGLTNHRGDRWGADRLEFARAVIRAVRDAAGSAIVGLRLSCDELAPWAGITPEMAPGIAADMCSLGVDYVVVVRGAIFSAEKTRPDFHEPTGFNIDVCRAVRAAVGASTAVFLQGSVVDVGQAEWAVEDGVCDGVEMTRAQIADAELIAKVRRGDADRVRPCIRCNQTCQVRDARNPIVSCVGDPSSGHETRDPRWEAPAPTSRRVLVVGAGPAGLEASRVAAARGHDVTVVDTDSPGGLASVAGPGGPLVDWLVRECEALGVSIRAGVEPDEWSRLAPSHDVVIQATGSRRGIADYTIGDGAIVYDVADIRRGRVALPDSGDVAVLDPIGGPIGVAFAEELGARAVLVTPDNIAGNELSRTGDLAPANVRLAQKGVHIERRSVVRAVEKNGDGLIVRLQDRFSGEVRTITVSAVVDAGFRLPTEPLPVDRALSAGDCVAPRTLYEAVLEGRRAAVKIS
ncbi:MAG: 2,4-dienoyl-CoA reductase [Acidimicrobiales bacterium mtb01]|nr:mycofactocin system FadH/OYE family oxidoreductase 1 [Actinomycetota bacterium]TEX46418.1 MAG: 2,4-dienoyl-CoA reductase [Acidimicrobiales bacterium mtb01]